MSIALVTLVTRLGELVDGLSEAQLEDMVRSAVAAFSDLAGPVRRASVNLVAGTATYELPADCISVIRLESMNSRGHTMITPQGLIPLGTDFRHETFTTHGRTLTIIPTPEYSMTRFYWYRGGYALGEGEVYEGLTEEMAEIALIKAQANALRVQASAAARDGWRYSIGDVMVDKSNLARAMREEATALDQEFTTRVQAFTGPAGARSYGRHEQAGYF